MLIIFLAHTSGYLLRGIVSSLGDPRRPTYTHPPTLQGFCTDAHRFTLNCWWLVAGVGWTTFRDSPYESDFILMTQARAIICCLLIFFIDGQGRGGGLPGGFPKSIRLFIVRSSFTRTLESISCEQRSQHDAFV